MRLAPAPKAVKVVDEVVVDEVAEDTAVVVDDATSKCHLYQRRHDKT
jgi:hypothetical protein